MTLTSGKYIRFPVKKNTFWEAGFGSVAYLNGSSSFNSVGNRITTKYSNAVKDVYDFYKK